MGIVNSSRCLLGLFIGFSTTKDIAFLKINVDVFTIVVNRLDLVLFPSTLLLLELFKV